MSKDELKDIIEKRYAKKEVLEDQKKKDLLNSEVYIPHTIDNKHYLLRLKYNCVIESGILVKYKSEAIIDGLIPLDQKVIALEFPNRQEGLKFYYNKRVKKEKK